MRSQILTLRLDNSLAKRIQKAAKLYGRSKSDFLRKAIEEYCNEIEFESALSHGKVIGKKNGLYTDEDVIKWMQERGQL